jgi:hypothetical protein
VELAGGERFGAAIAGAGEQVPRPKGHTKVTPQADAWAGAAGSS